jgi:hypothetical protein
MTRGHMALWLGLVSVVAAGCRASEPAAGSQSPEARQLQAASQGLCDAQVLISDGKISEAADVFEDRTHAYLHELAEEVQDVDRAIAAELLEAKERLEVALDAPQASDPAAVAVSIAELQRALADAAAAVDLPRPLCREGAS